MLKIFKRQLHHEYGDEGGNIIKWRGIYYSEKNHNKRYNVKSNNNNEKKTFVKTYILKNILYSYVEDKR